MLALGQILFGATFTIASSYALGRRLLRHRELPASIALAVGAALLAQIIFLLLLAGRVNAWTLGILGAAALALGYKDVRTKLPRPSWLWALFAPYAGLYLVHALTPEIQPDGYTYHLGLVSEWLRTGSLGRRVGFYEMLPQGLEMLFTMACAYGKHSAAKLIHFAFTVALIPLMIATAKRLGFPGTPAAAIFFFAPVVGVCGTAAYNDVALAFYILAVFYLLLEKPQPWMLLLSNTRKTELPSAAAVRMFLSSLGARTPPFALLAGALAGFCYAVKITGIIIAPAAAGFLLIRRQWRSAFLLSCGALFVIAPWMLRTAWMSGNPFAPLMNEWFPNPYFHITEEHGFTEWLRHYGAKPLELPLEVTVRGALTAGLTGPVFLLIPVGLVALRSRAGQLLWLAAVVCGIPWWANVGTRFLIPSMVFLALALVLAMPGRLAWVLVGAQAILCWPQVVEVYAAKYAWRLHGFPWEAALRVEDEQQYLRANLWEYRIAEMLQKHTKAGELVLDMASAPSAYVSATVVNPWQSAKGGRMVDAVALGSSPDYHMIHSHEFRWRAQPVSAIRVHWSSIQELQFFDRDKIVLPSRTWILQASPNPWEAPLAMDRNLASGWQRWDTRKENGIFEVRFQAPMQTTGVRVLSRDSEPGTAEVEDGSGWHRLLAPNRTPVIPSNLRPAAGRLIRREGFHYVLARIMEDGLGPISRDLVYSAGDWGLQRVDQVDGIHLLRVQ